MHESKISTRMQLTTAGSLTAQPIPVCHPPRTFAFCGWSVSLRPLRLGIVACRIGALVLGLD